MHFVHYYGNSKVKMDTCMHLAIHTVASMFNIK